MERPDPYWLPLELVRGTLVQIRNQLSEWELIGLAVPAAVHTKLAAAVERFSRAAVQKEDDCPPRPACRGGPARGAGGRRPAGRRLRRSGACGAAPQRRPGRLLLGADLGPTPLGPSAARPFLDAFNAA